MREAFRRPASAKLRDRDAEVGLGGVVEGLDERVLLEHRLDDAALDADAAAVNQAHFTQAGGMGRVHVFRNHRRNVARGERVQVERPFYWNVMRIIHPWCMLP